MHACIGERKGSPLQHSCLENPRDGGAWRAAIYRVAQSRTRLKWLSSRAETFLFSFVFFHCPPSLLQECAPSMYSLTGFLIDFSIGGKSLYNIVMVSVLQQHNYTYIASLHSPHPTPLDHQSVWLGSLCYIATSQACYTEWSKSEREKQIWYVNSPIVDECGRPGTSLRLERFPTGPLPTHPTPRATIIWLMTVPLEPTAFLKQVLLPS